MVLKPCHWQPSAPSLLLVREGGVRFVEGPALRFGDRFAGQPGLFGRRRRQLAGPSGRVRFVDCGFDVIAGPLPGSIGERSFPERPDFDRADARMAAIRGSIAAGWGIAGAGSTPPRAEIRGKIRRVQTLDSQGGRSFGETQGGAARNNRQKLHKAGGQARGSLPKIFRAAPDRTNAITVVTMNEPSVPMAAPRAP